MTRRAATLTTAALTVLLAAGCAAPVQTSPGGPVDATPPAGVTISAVIARQEAVLTSVKDAITAAIPGPDWTVDDDIEHGVTSGCKGAPAQSATGDTYGRLFYADNVPGYVTGVTRTWERVGTNAKTAADLVAPALEQAGYQRSRAGLFINQSGDSISVRPVDGSVHLFSETSCYADDAAAG